MSTKQPILTIFMVVRNEEKHISTVLNSLLCQTYSNFILTIVENGADDSTGAIVDNFAKQDNRITVIHLEQNDPNILFKMLDRIETIYYMFAAGHDFYAPAFIEKCLSALEADPHVVLAYPRASWIKDDKIIGDIPGVFDTRGMDSFSRILVVAYGLIENYQFYGIYRLSAYKSLRRHIVIGNDHILLSELAVIGTFSLVDEHLFFLRIADDWGNSEVYIKKHFPDETDGVRAFLKQIDAYMSISERVTDQLDKTLLKLSLFTMCLLRYRGTLDLFNESITSLFARPDFQDLADVMSDTVHYIEQKLQSENVEKSPSTVKSTIAPLPSDNKKSNLKIAGEEGEGKDLTQIQEGSEFETGLRELILSIKPGTVIETGTYIGTGTTRIITSALRDAGLVGTTFYSIECNPNHYQQALLNLEQGGLLPFVKPLLGLSVPRTILPTIEKIHDETVRNIAGNDIFVDHQEQNRVALYHRETYFPDIPDDLLGTCLEKFGSPPNLILLDSAGHMGNVEFNYVIERLKGECYVVLDDIHHVKHNRSFKQIQSDQRFKLLTSSREKFGFCIAKFTPENEFVADIKHILWLRADSIGDNILASSMLPYIKEKYTHAKITVVCQDHITELYEGSPFVDSVIGFDRLKGYQDEAYRNLIVQQLQALRTDLVLNSLYSRDPLYDLFVINSGARTSVTFNGNLCNISAEVRDYNNKFYTKVITDNETHKSELERHRYFLQGIGIQVSKLEPTIWLKPEDEDFAERFFKDNNLDPESTMCLFAGAQNDVRIYQSYGIALSVICKSYGLFIIAFGGSVDSEINMQNLDATGARTINLSGKTTLRKTAAILKRCRLAVGAETGLAHMACAVGTPNVILLGGGHFGRFLPYSPLTSIVCLPLECYNCNWNCRYDRVHCIKDINPEVIAEAVRQTLEKKSEKPRVFVQGTSLWEAGLQQPKWKWFNAYLDINTVEIIPVGIVPSIPKTANEQYKISQEHITSGNFDEAIIELEKLLDVYPDFALAHNDLGVIYYNKGDKESALKLYEQAVIFNPENINFQKNLADFYFVELGRTEDAIQIYIKVLAAHPDDIEALLAICKFCANVGKVAEAIIFCNRVLENDPQNNDVVKIIDLLNNQNKVMTVEQADAIAIGAVNKSEGYLVSAIVSVYKSEKFMRGKLDDLLNQTLADRIEIIVIDSNSPENEGAIIREYMAKHRNIRYLRTEERETVYQAWNRGIAMASGEFITNANTDDRLRRDCIEVLVRALCENPNKVLSYGDSIITLQENETFEQCTPHGYLRWPDFDRAKLLEFCFVGPHPVWRKSVHDEAGYFNVSFRCAADYEFWMRLAMNHDFVHVPELLGLYWQNEDTVSRKGDVPLIEAARIQQAFRSKYDRLSSGCQTGNIQKAPLPDRQIADLLIPDRGKPDSAGFSIKSVLYVVHGFPPAAVGGVEVYTQNLAKEMISRGLRVTVLYSATESSGDLYSITSNIFDGLTLAKFHVPRGNLFTSINSRPLDTAFDSFLKSHTFDLVHFHHVCDNLSLSMISVAKKANLPVVITLHDFWFICPRAQLFIINNTSVCSGPECPAKCANCLFVAERNPGISNANFEQVIAARQSYVRNLLIEVDLLFAPSRFVADIFERHGFGRGRIAVAPLGIGKFEVQRSMSAVGPRFGYMGTIHPVKNVMRLVEAFAETHGQARLDMYGGGEAFWIKVLKDSIHDPRIAYHGSYTPEMMPEMLSCMDVLVTPSLIESYCLTVREALSTGIPVLAARVGGIPEIVRNGVNGMLFDPFDQVELTRLLQQFISDRDMLQALNGKAIPVMSIADDAYFLLEQYAPLMNRSGEQILKANTVAVKPKIGLLSLDKHSFACPRIRLLSAVKFLERQKLIDYIDLASEEHQQFEIGKLKQLDILIVQRNFAKAVHYEKLATLLGEKRPKIIYEFDDAFGHMDKDHIAYPYYISMREEIEDYVRNSDLVTVSTEMLKSYYKKLNKNIVVIPNFIDAEIWRMMAKTKKRDDKIRLLFSGTIGHEPDLKIIEDVLVKILNEFNETVELLLWGNHNPRLEKLNNVKVLSEFKSDYSEYAEMLKNIDVDIALVPLEDTKFNQAKSHIKWLEYSACVIPGVYSNVGEYRISIKDGKNGIIVNNNHAEWYQAIKKLITDESLRNRIAQAAKDEVIAHNTVEQNAAQWLHAYRGLFKALGEDKPYVSIIIPVYNKIDYTKQCLSAITQNTSPNMYEIIIVDNGSNDGTGEFLKQSATIKVKIISNKENLGFAKACNQGAKAASCGYLLFLNNDTEPQHGWLKPLVEILDHDDSVAAVGSKLLYPDGTIQHSGIVIVDDRKNNDHLLAKNNHVGKPADSPEENTPTLHQAMTAACVLIRKSAFEKAGSFDEKYWNGYEDVDLCFKLQEHGGILVYQPASIVIHHESRSGPERFAKARDNIARLHKKWLGKIKPDFILNEDGAVTSTDAGKIRAYYTPGSPQATDINGIHLLSRYAVKTVDRPNTGDKDMLAVEQVYEAMQPVLLASRPEDAVRALENIVRSFPNFARAHSDLGMLYYQSSEKQKAVAHYERAATISPENADFQKNLADYYYVEMARAEDALKLYSKVLQARPKDVETLMTTGHILVSLQRFEEADAYYCKVLEIEPWNTAANEIHNKLSQRSRGGNGSRKAEDMYAEVKRLLDLNDHAGARRALEKMLGVCPHFALAHNDLAVLCYQSGDKDQALRHYEEAVRLQPENSTFQKNLGDFYYIEQGRIEDALRIYVRILETQPKDIETLMATGHICSSLSRWDDARTFYRRVLEIEPWKMEARKKLDSLENATTGAASLQFAPSVQDMYAEAACLVSAGSVQAGKDRLNDLVKLHPGFALAHNDLGVLAYRAEDNQSALLSYQTAVRLEPGNLTFKKNLADLYWKELGRIEDALKIYVDIMAAHPEDVETLLATGEICLSLRQPNDARVFFDRVLKIEPWNAEAHQQLRVV